MPFDESPLPWLIDTRSKMKENSIISKFDIHPRNDSRTDPMSLNVEMPSYRHAGSMVDSEAANISVASTRSLIQKFRFVSIFGLTSTMLCTWELALGTSYLSLLNGGVSSLVWNYLGSSIAMIVVVSCLAEMASMTPSSAGLYHWAGEFSPRPVQRYISYLVGWSSIVAWLSASAALNFLAGTMLQSVVALWHPDYQWENWHSTLIVIGIGLLSTSLNTLGSRALPCFELINLFVHFFGIGLVVVPLWALAPQAPAKQVFLNFGDGGGWTSLGLACLIGQVGPYFSLLRTEGGTQIAGRLPDAARLVPSSMMTTIFVNSAMGLVVVLNFAFSIPTDNLQAILSGTINHGYPFIQIYAEATGSRAWATVSTVLIIFCLIGASLSTQAFASRQVFAFARDEGVPFPQVWTKLYTVCNRSVPVNAFCLSLAATTIVALVDLRLQAGTATLQFAITLFTSFSASSCFITIGCVVVSRIWRIEEQQLPARLWSLGVLSVPLHLFALSYLGLIFVMSFFPLSLSGLQLSLMNWSSLVWGFVFIFSTLLYLVHSRYVFKRTNMLRRTII